MGSGSAADLTPREAAALALLEDGASRIEIGRALELEPAAVNALLDSMYGKAGPSGRVELRGRGLTAPQQQVIRLALEGHTNGTIAQRLYISPEIVRERLRAAYGQLGVRNRFEAIAVLSRGG